MKFLKRLLRNNNEEGVAAAEMALSFAFLLLPVTILVLSFPTWSARQTAARTAAREGARAAALSDVSDSAAAINIAKDTAVQVANNHNLTISPSDVTVTPGIITRDSTVTVSVAVDFPLLVTPTFGGQTTIGGGFRRSISHSEKVDQYRSF